MRDETPNCPTDVPGRHRSVAQDEARALEDFIAYWQSRRMDAPVPRRADIDPRGITPLLSNAFIIERIAPGLARLRVAGVHLSDLLGMEVRGMPLSAFFTPGHRDALAGHLVQVFDAPATLRLSLRAPGGHGAPALTGTLVLLPLSSDLGDVSRALGCLITSAAPGRAPRRFDITRSRITPIDRIGPARVTKPTSAPIAGLAEVSAPYTPQSRAERPYLRLVHSQQGG